MQLEHSQLVSCQAHPIEPELVPPAVELLPEYFAAEQQLLSAQSERYSETIAALEKQAAVATGVVGLWRLESARSVMSFIESARLG